MEGDALTNKLVALARRLHQTLPVADGDLASAPLDEIGAFELSCNVGDGWSLNAQHFGEQTLRDRQGVIIATVAHHEKPTSEPLLKAVRAVARRGEAAYHHLLGERLGCGCRQVMFERRK